MPFGKGGMVFWRCGIPFGEGGMVFGIAEYRLALRKGVWEGRNRAALIQNKCYLSYRKPSGLRRRMERFHSCLFTLFRWTSLKKTS